MSTLDASRSGTFKIGGDLEVHRLGFGAMRITGPKIWGEPADRAEAIRALKRLPELGIDFVDTADSYGPDVSEPLIKEALHPYGKMIIATKGGLVRPGADQWIAVGRPEYLIQQAHKSLRLLGVEQIDLWQLHRIDPKVPGDEQFDAIKSLLEAKIIRHAGLSEVSVAEIEGASKYFRVATVQNRFNLVDRASEDVLAYCESHDIGFIPWNPLAADGVSAPGSRFDSLARRRGVTHGQLALAWLLAYSRVMLPIPGTSRVRHLEENVAATTLELSNEEMTFLNGLANDIGPDS